MRLAVAAGAAVAVLGLVGASGSTAPAPAARAHLAAAPAPVTNATLGPGDPITIGLRLEGVVPVGLADVSVALDCRGLAGPRSRLVHTAPFGTRSGSAVLRFPLARAGAGNQGSSCSITITATGTGDLGTGFPLEVLVGGTRRAMTTPVLVPGRQSTQRSSLGPVPIDRSTDVRVTYVYPAIAVRKVVAGQPPVADDVYPLDLRCWNQAGTPVAPAGTTASPPFDGTFTLRAGERRVFGTAAFPTLDAASVCEVLETGSLGASVRYSSTDRGAVGDPDARARTVPGVLLAGVARSALTRTTAETITVTSRFTGELRVRKDGGAGDSAVTVTVTCDPTDAAGAVAPVQLAAGQSRLYRGLLAGARCTVDPGGRRVTIKLRTADPASVATVTLP